MIRILGIDPGSRVTGYGIVDLHERGPAYVASGCIRTVEADLPERLQEIFRALSVIVTEYRPQEAAIERVFVSRNVDSALKLGQARGAAICAVVNHSLPVAEYSATQVKQAVVGTGRAAKDQVQHMIRALLSLPGAPQADAADALAIAVCHAHCRQSLQRFTPSYRRSR